MTPIFDAFRRPIRLEPPTHQPIQVSDTDIAVKTAWGLTLTQWTALTDQDRTYYRDNVAHAERAA